MKAYRGFPGLALLVGLIGLLAWTACGSSGTLGDRVVVTSGIFDELPLTDVAALAGGWTALTDIAVDFALPSTGCVPNHGRHFVKSPADPQHAGAITFAGTPIDPITVLMNAAGEFIGIELASLGEQVVPPWEYSPKGHPDMDFEHWHMHIYLSDPAKAC